MGANDKVEATFHTGRDIYTESLLQQSDAEAVNSILWRLAIALGVARRGQREGFYDPDVIMAMVEERLSIYGDDK